MTVDVRLVGFGALLLFASSGLFFEAGVSGYLAGTIAGVAVVGTALAALRAGGSDARAA
ncbi:MULTISPECIES: hypothetical protein [Halobellus]|uniref:Uncharacterized protein n=2 Tax=Halobellus TaxID=1073986 RepID=A0ABD6DRP8_9EURY|nr:MULTISPECIES: hypothetical protein [Halobellus]